MDFIFGWASYISYSNISLVLLSGPYKDLFSTSNILNGPSNFIWPIKIVTFACISCTDPDSLAEESNFGIFSVFFSQWGREDLKITYKQAIIGPASETPFKWCFAGGPMMAQH